MSQIFLQRKAIYNLLQINLPRIESGELKVADLRSWQTENYRLQTTDILIKRLYNLNISLNDRDFTTYAKTFEEPEEMLHALAKEKKPLEQDEVFLLIFELWRRLFPEKQTLSIFCDELDYQMTQYDLQKENDISNTLEYLLQILEENVDKGLKPRDVLDTFQSYCANEIESFLFDYILAQIEEGDRNYASELTEGFYPYIKDTIWFDYLKARIDFLNDPEEGCEQFEKLIRRLKDEISIDLVEEMLYFLADLGNHTLFYGLAQKMLNLMEVEEDFREFLEICYIHYDHLQLEKPCLVLSEIFHRRKKIANDEPLDSKNPDMEKARTILNQKLNL